MPAEALLAIRQQHVNRTCVGQGRAENDVEAQVSGDGAILEQLDLIAGWNPRLRGCVLTIHSTREFNIGTGLLINAAIGPRDLPDRLPRPVMRSLRHRLWLELGRARTPNGTGEPYYG